MYSLVRGRHNNNHIISFRVVRNCYNANFSILKFDDLWINARVLMDILSLLWLKHLLHATWCYYLLHDIQSYYTSFMIDGRQAPSPWPTQLILCHAWSWHLLPVCYDLPLTRTYIFPAIYVTRATHAGLRGVRYNRGGRGTYLQVITPEDVDHNLKF